MPTIVACKLPHGLTIRHGGQTININGSNAMLDPLNPPKNGESLDGAALAGGFGLTTLTDDEAKAFEDWSNQALYKGGTKANGLLDEPFMPLVNGSISTYKNESDARKESSVITDDVETGFTGLDGDAEIKKAAAAADPNLVNSGADKGK